MKLWDKLEPIINADPLAAQVMVGMTWLALGLVLLWPTNSFAASHAYDVLAQFMPENVAGALLTAIGITILATIVFGSKRAQRTQMLWSFGLWVGLLVTFVLSPATGALTYSVACVSSLWAYLRMHKLGANP